jgi:hypothetical protein
MSRGFFELAVRARRYVGRTTNASRAPRGPRLTARRQLGGGELTQFSFRLAFVIDLAYVGIGALGGAAVGRASAPNGPPVAPPPACHADSLPRPGNAVPPNACWAPEPLPSVGMPPGVIR